MKVNLKDEMEIKGNAELQGLPGRERSPGRELPTSETPLGDPPLWHWLLDESGRTAVKAAERALLSLAPSADDDLVPELLETYASWVLDLPASKKNHHAGPYGLFRHSVEVASQAVQELEKQWGQGRGCSVLSPAEVALWSKVTVALGLFHDCGKMLDFEVGGSLLGPCWDPFEESLAAFKARHGKEVLAATSYHFRPGRGLTGHEHKGIRLLAVILGGARWHPLRPPLEAAYHAFVFRNQVPISTLPIPLAYLAERVHRADVASARRDWWKKRHPEPDDIVRQEVPSGRL